MYLTEAGVIDLSRIEPPKVILVTIEPPRVEPAKVIWVEIKPLRVDLPKVILLTIELRIIKVTAIEVVSLRDPADGQYQRCRRRK
jgi:hypothetical protein